MLTARRICVLYLNNSNGNRVMTVLLWWPGVYVMEQYHVAIHGLSETRTCQYLPPFRRCSFLLLPVTFISSRVVAEISLDAQRNQTLETHLLAVWASFLSKERVWTQTYMCIRKIKEQPQVIKRTITNNSTGFPLSPSFFTSISNFLLLLLIIIIINIIPLCFFLFLHLFVVVVVMLLLYLQILLLLLLLQFLSFLFVLLFQLKYKKYKIYLL